MLVILTPEQVPRFWDDLKYYIESSLPIHQRNGYNMSKVLMNILGGVLLVGFLTDHEHKIVAVLTFSVRRDTITEVCTLEILTGYAERILMKDEVEDMMVTIKKLAVDKRCKNIIFYTDIKESIEMFKKSGATLHGHLIWEV